MLAASDGTPASPAPAAPPVPPLPPSSRLAWGSSAFPYFASWRSSHSRLASKQGSHSLLARALRREPQRSRPSPWLWRPPCTFPPSGFLLANRAQAFWAVQVKNMHALGPEPVPAALYGLQHVALPITGKKRPGHTETFTNSPPFTCQYPD